MKKKYKVTFLPDKKSGYFESGTSLRDAAIETGIIIESSCGGAGTCGKCKVMIIDSSMEEAEQKIFSGQLLINEKNCKLSCREQIQEDTLCFVPESSRTIKDQILTEGKSGRFPLDADIKKIFLDVPEPKLGEKYFDIDSIIKLLNEKSHKVTGYSYKIISSASEILRNSNYKVTVVIDNEELIAIESGDTTGNLYGVAVDIGTTTIALKLLNIRTGEVCAISSALNRQQHYGADIISRINYVIQKEEGLNRLHTLIIHQINVLIKQMCNSAEINLKDIYKIVIAGNTVMQHICLNVSPKNLAFTPYTPTLQGPIYFKAEELKFEINKSGKVYFLPNLGGFVGSDITSVLTILELEECEEKQLVIDIGTNGEIVIGSKSKIVCASSPAGPAWEGACITNGMRAAAGAIESAEIVNGELIIRTIGNTDPIGLCGSGLHDMVIELIRAGIIDNGGRIVNQEELSGALNNGKLKDRIVKNDNGSNDFNIYKNKVVLTQKDVREVQLAKAAISAGINILLNDLGISAKNLSSVYIAGAFGNHLRAKDAIDLGLLPEIDEDKIKFIGNAALSGAEAILLSTQARKKAEYLSQIVEYIEISGREDFQEIFINSILFSKI